MGANRAFIKARISTNLGGQDMGWAVFIDSEVSDNDSRRNGRGVSDVGANLVMSEGGNV